MRDSSLSRRGVLGVATALSVGQATHVAAAPQKMALAFELRPEEFGAISDGVADCSDAFDQALASMRKSAALEGRYRKLNIRLASGIYRLTRPVRIDGQDVIVRGGGSQNTALLIDHSDTGLIYSGEGDSSFEGLSIIATPARFASKAKGVGFLSDPGRPRGGQARSTIRLTLRDFHVQRQPGDGILIINPEAARLENVTSSQNGGSGCHIFGRDIENILNLLDFCRFSENMGHGLSVNNISCSIFSRIECLNNKSVEQLSINGSYNQIIQPDCEAFGLAPDEMQRVGIAIHGHGNQIIGGAFFKLNIGILIGDGEGNRVVLPKFDGTSNRPLSIGVRIDNKSKNSSVHLTHSNFVAKLVDDAGKASRLNVNGRQQAARSALSVVHAQIERDKYIPDIDLGHVFRFTATSPLEILAPNGLMEGDLLTFIVDLTGEDVDLSFSPSYRGAIKALGAKGTKGTVVLRFIALTADELVLLSACHSD